MNIHELSGGAGAFRYPGRLLKPGEMVPHGLRVTLRTWVDEMTDAPFAVVPFAVRETAPGHQLGSEVALHFGQPCPALP